MTTTMVSAARKEIDCDQLKNPKYIPNGEEIIQKSGLNCNGYYRTYRNGCTQYTIWYNTRRINCRDCPLQRRTAIIEEGANCKLCNGEDWKGYGPKCANWKMNGHCEKTSAWYGYVQKRCCATCKGEVKNVDGEWGA